MLSGREKIAHDDALRTAQENLECRTDKSIWYMLWHSRLVKRMIEGKVEGRSQRRKHCFDYMRKIMDDMNSILHSEPVSYTHLKENVL